jgi:hypothetical protein
MIEHLADSLADHMLFAAAAGARLMLEIEPHVLTGADAPAGLVDRAAISASGPSLMKGGFDPRDIGVEAFKTELQLVVIRPFGAPTKLAARQLLNDEPEAFDLRLRLSEVGAFDRERPDHPLQRLHIVWQSGKIDMSGEFTNRTRAAIP